MMVSRLIVGGADIIIGHGDDDLSQSSEVDKRGLCAGGMHKGVFSGAF
jgi:hypothetical protein